MPSPISRRSTLKLLAASAVAGVSRQASGQDKTQPASDRWANSHDRVWLSGDVWANPMEDWCLHDGGAECRHAGPGRSIHSLTHQLVRNARFSMAVTVLRVDDGKQDHGAGFRIGLKSELDEYRSNCFVVEGIAAGWGSGRLVLGPTSAPLKQAPGSAGLRLTLHGGPDGDHCLLKLVAQDASTLETLGEVSHRADAKAIIGNVSLAHNLSPVTTMDIRFRAPSPPGARYRFHHWTMSGEGFSAKPEQSFGPLLWAMYSLSDSRGEDGFVLKLSALTGPLGARDNREVELLVQQDGLWNPLATAALDTDAWVATFRIPDWDETKSVPYKLIYRENRRDGTSASHEWTGSIRANPTSRPLRMAALTCQNHYAFPYAPVADNLVKLDPDLLFFSGDQIYESHGGFGVIREPVVAAIHCYLRKYYQFGWAFRDAMRHAPTLCLPDDHDVFQGNLWGAGGIPMQGTDTSTGSGYLQQARMVNAVHKTTVAHHPDPYDPAPVQQDITTYYGDMVYGGVGFAILADRQWKSGPSEVDTGGGRLDHVMDKDFDTAALDKPGLVLLGGRQEEFLRAWSADWRGHALKAVLSQTIFAAVATHHGSYDGYLKADLDSGGWPQTARNRAIDIMRPSMALHINGDQHLGSLVQYGVRQQRDSNWAFCTPAIASGYPRWWRPDDIGMPHANRPAHGLPHTGEYLDGFGNMVYVHAVENPQVGKNPHRYRQAHEKGSGFGFITFDTGKKTYHIESYRFLIDATDGKPSNQFNGWPHTIHQEENRGHARTHTGP